MNSMFYPAVRSRSRLRMAIDGPAGSGKTYTALSFAFAMADHYGARVAVIDTEHESSAKYQGLCTEYTQPWNFDICPLKHFAPSTYTQAINEAGRLGYGILIVDSLSHAWQGKGGALAQVDQASGNSFSAWKDVTPQHNEMIEAILSSPCHVLATMRSKMDYVLEPDAKGKMVPKKVGMAPVQRAGMEYEFDIIVDMDIEHAMRVSKSRCPTVEDTVVVKPAPFWIHPIIGWLESGFAAVPLAVSQQPAPPASLPARTNGASEEQRNRIIAIAQQIGMPPEALVEALARRGVNRIADLDYKQAEGLYEGLYRVRMDQDAEALFSRPSAAGATVSR